MESVTSELERKRAGLTVDQIAQDGTFSGYASLFGEVDLGRDMVERGAFARSLRRRGATGIRLLFQHDPSEPVGRWTEVREDERGLFVRGQLATSSARGREVLALLRDGALDGLSIGYRTVRARKDAATGIRRILEADLWEISIVTFPMLTGARISSVKGRRLPTKREFERWLTRDAGLTRGDALTVISEGFDALRNARDAVCDTNKALAEKIRRVTRTIPARET